MITKGEIVTYPPQQPGQWGQQPDPYGQQPGQSPWGQQPDPYGGQSGQSPWGQQPYQMGPPPPKKKGGLMAALIIVAILVVGGGGTGLYFLLNNEDKDPAGGGGGSSKEDGPRAAADAFTEELQKLANVRPRDLDAEPLKPYVCAEDFKRFDEDLEDVREYASTASNEPTNESVKLSVANFKETDDGATFDLHRESENSEGDQKLKVVEEGDNWVVCGLYEEDEDQPTSPPSTGGGGGNTDIPNPIPTT